MDQFIDYLHSLPDYLIYMAILASAFVENILPPFPGDTITAFGAFLVGIGRLNLFFVILAATTGSLCGFITLFWIGLRLGRRFFSHREPGIFSSEKIQKAESWFIRYGYFIILINRFLPGIRSVIAIVAGISKLDSLKVTILALISSISWNLIWILMGYLLGNNWETVEERLSHIFVRYNISVFTLFLMIAAYFILKGLIRGLIRR